MNDYTIYCAGEFVSTKQKLKVTNKYTGKTYATTYLADQQLLDKAVKAAQKAKHTCADLSLMKNLKR
ncbi:MAG: aldehyde dehydrogenase family protein [Bacteroidia bacterium]|nr:aldehyde dehydrogenase family protein [Bacteroidia bacterium]